MDELPATITIDGPSGTGKGTIASLLADHLGFYLLDSGALYRALAWVVLKENIDPASELELEPLLGNVDIELKTNSPAEIPEIWCQGQRINEEIRQEAVGNMASKIAAIPLVRAHLLIYQRMMRRSPGLIADGRDMGSVVFPDASLKFYLDASTEIRAERRYKQLKLKGIDVNLLKIREDLVVRDYRDEHRDVSPMKAMPDMIRIDTTGLDIEQVYQRVMAVLQEQLPIIN